MNSNTTGKTTMTTIILDAGEEALLERLQSLFPIGEIFNDYDLIQSSMNEGYSYLEAAFNHLVQMEVLDSLIDKGLIGKAYKDSYYLENINPFEVAVI